MKSPDFYIRMFSVITTLVLVLAAIGAWTVVGYILRVSGLIQ